jgi:7-cyano-7-deazaguanine synthase in queuosine biosynthesis
MTHAIIAKIDSILLQNKTIGIFVSGGFDSTLLVYLMHTARDRLDSKNIFKFFVVPQHNQVVKHATRVINSIDEKFNIVPTELCFVGNPDLHHTEQVISGVRQLFSNMDTYKVDMVLLGDTTNPDELPDGPIRIQSVYPRIYQPFYDYTKDAVVQICIDMSLDDVMTLTHTCTEQVDGRCNECWQCKERAWAFKQCNYTDPGTM